MRPPQSDQDAIKVWLLPADFFYGNLSEVEDEGGKPGQYVNRDLSKVSMCLSDGLECRRNPFDVRRSTGMKDRISEFCYL